MSIEGKRVLIWFSYATCVVSGTCQLWQNSVEKKSLYSVVVSATTVHQTVYSFNVQVLFCSDNKVEPSSFCAVQVTMDLIEVVVISVQLYSSLFLFYAKSIFHLTCLSNCHILHRPSEGVYDRSVTIPSGLAAIQGDCFEIVSPERYRYISHWALNL